MKKLALILNTRYSAGTLVGCIFFAVGLFLLPAATLVPRAGIQLFIQGGMFCCIGIVVSQLFSVDHLCACFLLPTTAYDFVAAKTIQIVAASIAVNLILTAVFIIFTRYAQVELNSSLALIPVFVFPLMCTFGLLVLAVFLSGNSFVLIIMWIVICLVPGIFGAFLQAGVFKMMQIIKIMQRYPVIYIIIGVYLICLFLSTLFYFLSLHNFNKLQFNRYMQIDKGQKDFRSI